MIIKAVINVDKKHIHSELNRRTFIVDNLIKRSVLTVLVYRKEIYLVAKDVIIVDIDQVIEFLVREYDNTNDPALRQIIQNKIDWIDVYINIHEIDVSEHVIAQWQSHLSRH